jgi:hypothetical protein
MTKVDLLAAVVLLISSSVGLVNDQKSGKNFKRFPAIGIQRLAAWTNNKQENVDQIQVENITKHSHLPEEKYKYFCS